MKIQLPKLVFLKPKKTQQKYNYNADTNNTLKKLMKCMHQEKLSMYKK
jgi:hypothetical protein